jgi:SpoVK/Ycf46/Vps4 family AAA+-type ATPase
MVGLENVKDSITELLGRAKYNYQREIQGQASLQTSLNRVFLGPPGTGKTTVAQLYGQVISDLGLLSDGGVVMKTPGDFMSWKVGEAEEKAANILDGAQGKVLIIDEAHSLYHISGRGTNVTDRMRQGIIETIVAKVSGTPDEDRCVILTGYPHEMEEMFQNSNAGLRRRFPEEQTFHFRGYDEQQLGSILDSKLVDYGLGATEDAKRVARDVLNRMRVRPNFGHGGDVENLISRAKAEHRKRSLLPATEENDVPDFATNTNIILDPEDFDRDYTRTSSSESCRSLFRDFVGFEKIVSVFEGYQEMAVGMRLHGIDPRPHIPFAFVFKGPPGTGKTSTARKIGRVFYDLGFLSTDEVIECSATDLVGEWLGHTGPKVLNLLDKALGKVLFVDEAYRLNVGTRGLSGGSFHEEAISELVDAMTKPRYAQKMVIILAGYSKEMDRLMDGNPGLRGRFATHLVFPHMQPKHCLYHLMQEIGKLNIEIRDEDDPGDEKSKKVYKLFSRLSATKHWANGRDVESLARTVIAHVFRKQGRAAKKDRAASRPLTISTDELIQFLQDMLRERKGKNDEEQSGK